MKRKESSNDLQAAYKTKRRTLLRSLCLMLVLEMFTLGLLLTAHSTFAAVNKTVHLTAGKASTVELPADVADILVANPSIADVGALKTNRLYVVGRELGTTNVLAFNDSGDLIADIAVHVKVDENTLQDSLAKFFPSERVNVTTVGKDIVLAGQVSSPAVANQVRDLAARFVGAQNQSIMDLMTVAGEQQVMLQVKIMEVSRSALREYGIRTSFDPDATSGLALQTAVGLGLSAPQAFADGSLFIQDGGFGPLTVNLRALEQRGYINTLAEPNLTAISGETAGFLAGGEFPVPAGRDNVGNVTIEFKRFGVSLNFTPRVMSADRISLLLNTEVSTLDQENGISLLGIDIPGLSVRRAQTTVEMGSGGTLMIAGLIQSETTQGLSGLPGASSIPILGDLFKSKSFNREESEVLIVVTPILVKPYGEAQAVARPAPALDTYVPAQGAVSGVKGARMLSGDDVIWSAPPANAPTEFGQGKKGASLSPVTENMVYDDHPAVAMAPVTPVEQQRAAPAMPVIADHAAAPSADIAKAVDVAPPASGNMAAVAQTLQKTEPAAGDDITAPASPVAQGAGGFVTTFAPDRKPAVASRLNRHLAATMAMRNPNAMPVVAPADKFGYIID